MTAVEAYDPATSTWTTAASLPIPRAYPNGAAVIDNRIYLPGGSGCDAPGCDETSTLLIFDPATGPQGSWTIGAIHAEVPFRADRAVQSTASYTSLPGGRSGRRATTVIGSIRAFDAGRSSPDRRGGTRSARARPMTEVVRVGGEDRFQPLHIYDPGDGLVDVEDDADRISASRGRGGGQPSRSRRGQPVRFRELRVRPHRHGVRPADGLVDDGRSQFLQPAGHMPAPPVLLVAFTGSSTDTLARFPQSA